MLRLGFIFVFLFVFGAQNKQKRQKQKQKQSNFYACEVKANLICSDEGGECCERNLLPEDFTDFTITIILPE